MEQGATGINSSVPTASLTGRIWFFLLLLRTSTHRSEWANRLLERLFPPLRWPGHSPRTRVDRGTVNPRGTSPGRRSALFRSNLVRGGLAVAQRGGAVRCATLRSPEPHSPSGAPCTAHAMLRAKQLPNPRIRRLTRALRMPCPRIATTCCATWRKAHVTQQNPDTHAGGVKRRAERSRTRVSPPAEVTPAAG